MHLVFIVTGKIINYRISINLFLFDFCIRISFIEIEDLKKKSIQWDREDYNELALKNLDSSEMIYGYWIGFGM